MHYALNNVVSTANPVLSSQNNVIPSEAEGSLHSPYSFTGKELDDSDLYYFEARYYDPLTSRFASIDPMVSEVHGPNHDFFGRYTGSSQEQNFNMYTLGNPINKTDPLGLFSPPNKDLGNNQIVIDGFISTE